MQLAIMTLVMFVAMYGLMYTMVNRFENVYPNVNQCHMAGMMTAPMILIELVIMRTMYQNRTASIVIVVVILLAFTGLWAGIREQVAVPTDSS